MPTTPASTKDLPLPVRILRAAMEQQRSLAEYAQSLDISADSLGAIVTAQLDHLEPGTWDRLAELYQQSRETLRDHLSITPAQELFAAWLKRNMEGISQLALRTRLQLDSKTFKRFLNGEMLPDSDQAERLARALYIDRTELARVVTASMSHQAAAEHLVDTTGTSADQLMPSLAITEENGTIRSAPTRRQKATSHAEQTSAEGAAANGGTSTAETVKEPRTEPEADIARGPAARRQVGTKTAGPAPAPITTPPIDAVPTPEIEHARQPAADRQAGTTTAAASERTTSSPVGAMVHRDNPTVAATRSDILPAFNAPTQRSTRKQRRSEGRA
jgi:transcriptional regulator with XRE-family HTH domain